jgi:hypothetical protein
MRGQVSQIALKWDVGDLTLGLWGLTLGLWGFLVII